MNVFTFELNNTRIISEIRKANFEGTFFLTFTAVGWIDVFTREVYCKEIIENLQFCQQNKSIDIFAYVIMPSHIHLLVRRNEGLLSDWLRDYKSYTAKRIIELIQNNPQESRKEWLLYMFKYFAKASKQNKEFMFWQKTSHPIEINNAEMMQQKINYIHQNPVESGIVNQAENYKYSSACMDSDIKILVA